MSGCRVGKVTLKDSRLAVYRPRADRWSLECQRAMGEHAKIIGGLFESAGPGRLAGFAIVAWGIDGSWSRGTRMHPDSLIGKTSIPMFVAEVLRRDISHEVVCDALGLEPNPPRGA